MNQRKKNVTQAIKFVSEKLKNTPAVCRSSYVHPVILERYMGAALHAKADNADAEAMLLTLLRE